MSEQYTGDTGWIFDRSNGRPGQPLPVEVERSMIAVHSTEQLAPSLECSGGAIVGGRSDVGRI